MQQNNRDSAMHCGAQGEIVWFYVQTMEYIQTLFGGLNRVGTENFRSQLGMTMKPQHGDNLLQNGKSA